VNKADPVGHEADGLDVLQPRYILTSHIVAMIGSAGWGLDQRASSARLGTSSAEGSVPSRPRLPDSPAGFPRVVAGLLAGLRSVPLSGVVRCQNQTRSATALVLAKSLPRRSQRWSLLAGRPVQQVL
jgi:hypothetical protein